MNSTIITNRNKLIGLRETTKNGSIFAGGILLKKYFRMKY